MLVSGSDDVRDMTDKNSALSHRGRMMVTRGQPTTVQGNPPSEPHPRRQSFGDWLYSHLMHSSLPVINACLLGPSRLRRPSRICGVSKSSRPPYLAIPLPCTYSK
ncbi:unnamed protein product [Protopolystoma xenopodis]|uniref:Uncharacterized protein n=1 Tax=Protopolystoma xenopodis TaxID=117903 RepID=A0A3S4ZM66_9PLAT|nr:unnamed protein product [Protopolystoma xenopodis]